MLTDRQGQVLRTVVSAHLETGRPVGSRAIAAREEGREGWSPSTIRSELAVLEDAGYLTHPHTSAGRIPTDSGYRFYVDSLLEADAPVTASRHEPALVQMRREVEDAIRDTTAELSRITDLLAVVTAPPLRSARVHRVEVLRPQPKVVTVVVIASNGEVSKRTFRFTRPVDSGLVKWASSYLNERLAGLALGSRMLPGRIESEELSAKESEFLAEVEPALIDVEDQVEQTLFLDGASRLLSEEHSGDIPKFEELMRGLERRVNLLGMLRSVLDERSVFTWIGDENPQPELRSVSVVGANYGLGYRNLGAVGVMGPLRMDYATAISSVRDAAGELSRYFETVYDE
jgi:heat-inducible transcriptional repressor